MTTPTPAEVAQRVAATFCDDVLRSSIRDRTNTEQIGAALTSLLATWDGTHPVLLQPFYDLLKEAHGSNVAGGALLHLKNLADRNKVVVDLPKQLKVLRLQERQELALYFSLNVTPSGTPAQPKADAAPAPVATLEGALAAASADAPPASTAKRRWPVQAALVGLLVVLLAALAFHFLLRGDPTAAQKEEWVTIVLPEDSAGLPCKAATSATDTVICTMGISTFKKMTKEELRTRTQITRNAVRTLGKAHVRIVTEDGVTRGGF